MIGFIIGVISGAAQYLLLARYTRSIIGGDFSTKNVIAGVFQFFIPLVVLLGCAFLLPGSLAWAGAGMAASLLGCAGVRFILHNRRNDGFRQNDGSCQNDGNNEEGDK